MRQAQHWLPVCPGQPAHGREVFVLRLVVENVLSDRVLGPFNFRPVVTENVSADDGLIPGQDQALDPVRPQNADPPPIRTFSSTQF